MNERFLELAEQATIKSVSENFTGEKLEIVTPSKEWAEKFAQLIVKECSKWVNDNLGLLDEDAETDLLKHFGVEE